MFYDEKVLNGVLHYRNISGGPWIEVTKEELTEKYLREKDNNGGYAQLCEGWRDMRQELPPIEHQAYFVYDKEGSMGFAHYLGEGIFGGWPDVIAWMPLPSPPAFV